MCQACGNKFHPNLYPDARQSFREGVSLRPIGLAGSLSFENGQLGDYLGAALNNQVTAPIFVASYNFRGQLDIGPLTQYDVYRTTISVANPGTIDSGSSTEGYY